MTTTTKLYAGFIQACDTDTFYTQFVSMFGDGDKGKADEYVMEKALALWPAAGGYSCHVVSLYEMPSQMDRLQQEVGEWAISTFPHSTPDSIASHLAEEVIELLGTRCVAEALTRARERAEIADDETVHVAPADNPQEESADVHLLLLHLAHRLKFSLEKEARMKFAINQARKWDTGAERGYQKHVDTGGDGE